MLTLSLLSLFGTQFESDRATKKVGESYAYKPYKPPPVKGRLVVGVSIVYLAVNTDSRPSATLFGPLFGLLEAVAKGHNSVVAAGMRRENLADDIVRLLLDRIKTRPGTIEIDVLGIVGMTILVGDIQRPIVSKA